MDNDVTKGPIRNACHLSWYGVDLLDFALFAEFCYYDDSSIGNLLLWYFLR